MLQWYIHICALADTPSLYIYSIYILYPGYGIVIPYPRQTPTFHAPPALAHPRLRLVPFSIFSFPRSPHRCISRSKPSAISDPTPFRRRLCPSSSCDPVQPPPAPSPCPPAMPSYHYRARPPASSQPGSFTSALVLCTPWIPLCRRHPRTPRPPLPPPSRVGGRVRSSSPSASASFSSGRGTNKQLLTIDLRGFASSSSDRSTNTHPVRRH
jgi:hypothetical protein